MSSAKPPCIAADASATAPAPKATTAECPIANQKPTATGRWPSCISLRVTLPMAAVWSGSAAWRRPKPWAVSAVPSRTGCSRNGAKPQIQAAAFTGIKKA